MSDGEEDASDEGGVVANENAEAVLRAEKLKRETEKEGACKQRQKDKEDRCVSVTFSFNL